MNSADCRTPTAIAGGAHDDFLTPKYHFHVAGLIPGAVTRTFGKAGHFAHFETPDAFNIAVDNFLARRIAALRHVARFVSLS